MNNRTHSQWVEGGLNFRSNLLTAEGVIPLHAHSYDHVALITYGWFAVKEITADGEERNYQMASKGYRPQGDREFMPVGYRAVIPAWHKHEFTLIEYHEQPGEVLCMWPEGI